ncbi:drug/metabolite transporter (DMT)-like permease [Kitasatospora gansuensis]|uniref:Drug/metabolite transporter (DMT)-like permease n=1 Tax=Kitasatospora gansuensis TaxID=258050 RepID=A0A7W7SBU5_9ACTN|nr:DMT family transporter [Kitasatospora gansuensis]MBB4947402.1 drug/metabolite transporter (DMT)-like permease [Kitasatospora gansuensis]
MRMSAAQTVRDLPVLGVAVVWGSSFLAVKNVATADSVVAMLVLRFGLVLPLLALFTWRALVKLTVREWLGGAVLGLVLGAIFLLETYGAVHTSATNAGLIISLTMVFTPLAESVLSRTALPRVFVAAAGLSVVGVALLTGGGGFRVPGLGDLLVLGAAVVRTVNVLTMSRLRIIKGTDSSALTWVQLATATLVFALVAPFVGPSPLALAASYGAADWALLLHLSLLCTLFAFLVQTWAVRATSPSRVSLLLGTEPLWAAVFGITLAGDHLGPLALLGALLVLVGTEWGRRSAAPAPAPEPVPVAAGQREPALERR